jgi:K+-transporting ATPase KdpF subunit
VNEQTFAGGLTQNRLASRPWVSLQRQRAFSEHYHDGRCHDGDRFRLFRSIDRLRLRLRLALRGTIMVFDYSLAGLVTTGLLIYLIYALLKPELF